MSLGGVRTAIPAVTPHLVFCEPFNGATQGPGGGCRLSLVQPPGLMVGMGTPGFQTSPLCWAGGGRRGLGGLRAVLARASWGARWDCRRPKRSVMALRRVIARCLLSFGFAHSGLPIVLVRSHKTWQLVKGVVGLRGGEHLA